MKITMNQKQSIDPEKKLENKNTEDNSFKIKNF